MSHALQAVARERATLIDGKAFSASLLRRIASATAQLGERGIQPGLAVVLVGEHPASQVYVRSKVRETVAAGMKSMHHVLPQTITQTELLDLIHSLNQDDEVNGILVQLPLPGHIDDQAVIAAIDPDKDVDGFHPMNAGRLAIGGDGLVACTPLGCMLLIKSVLPDLAGLDVAVIGKSNIVGRPMAQLLMHEGCTVTVAHSLTRNVSEVCRRADLVVVAVGRAGLVRREWVKPGAVVIDVGINHVVGEDGKARIVGDVATDEVAEVASAITPVPGGVGPMTIACLLRNTLETTYRRHGLIMQAL